MLEAITLDQMAVFAAVADEGSFSAAARRLGRAQSAITYAVQRLEDQIGVPLFDREAYRPALTPAGKGLLPRARRILQEVADFRLQARGMADGLEAEVAIAVDAMFPMADLWEVLRDFQVHFPTVQTRIAVETLGGTVQALLDGSADIAVANYLAAQFPELRNTPLAEIELIPVAAPSHPLALLEGPLTADQLRDHVQLVLTDRSPLTEGRDHGVVAARTWRLGDLGAKHAMLLAGLGWGSMPGHMVADDLAEGRLAPLHMADASGWHRLPIVAAVKAERPLGPAGRWMAERLTGKACPG